MPRRTFDAGGTIEPTVSEFSCEGPFHTVLGGGGDTMARRLGSIGAPTCQNWIGLQEMPMDAPVLYFDGAQKEMKTPAEGSLFSHRGPLSNPARPVGETFAHTRDDQVLEGAGRRANPRTELLTPLPSRWEFLVPQ